MKIVFATHNLHKLKEVRPLLPPGLDLLSLTDIGCFEDIVETGETLEENALIKANYIYEHYHYNCFADDTGLEVSALNGRPGVYSARYAGLDADANANMDKLLKELEGQVDRKAQFRTVIALKLNGMHLIDGICDGEILLEKSGEMGFGYDPIFRPTGFVKSFSEMTLGEKNKISHRARAMAGLIKILSAQI